MRSVRSMVVRVAVVAMLGAMAFGAEASTSGDDPFNALGPLEAMVNFFTGGFGRFLTILGLAAAALMWWKSREEMSEKFFGLIGWGVGGALLLGAPAIVDALGFASAVV